MIVPEGYGRDYTGRLEQRPYYRENTLEEGAIRFLRDQLEKEPTWPISDDDLDFIADLSASFDRGRDLDELGPDVDAVTVFSVSGPPRIILSKRLLATNMRLRRRMTIAHELGHVVLHHPLYQRGERQLNLLHEFRNVPAYWPQRPQYRGSRLVRMAGQLFRRRPARSEISVAYYSGRDDR